MVSVDTSARLPNLPMLGVEGRHAGRAFGGVVQLRLVGANDHGDDLEPVEALRGGDDGARFRMVADRVQLWLAVELSWGHW